MSVSKGLTPEEEVDEIDLVVIPRDFSDLSPYVTGYRFSYWKTEYEDRCMELVSRPQMSGEVLWALKEGSHCFNKRTRQWEYERTPSSRSDAFLRDCRMTMGEAQRIVPRELWKMHSHARRKVARMIRVRHWRETGQARKAAMQDVVNLFAKRLEAAG